MKGDCCLMSSEKSNLTRMFLLKVIDNELIASEKKISIFHHRSNTNFIINFKENFCSSSSTESPNKIQRMQSFHQSNKSVSQFSESNLSKISTSLTTNQTKIGSELSADGVAMLRKYCYNLRKRNSKKESDLCIDRKVRNYMTQILDDHFLKELKLLVSLKIPQKKKISFNY